MCGGSKLIKNVLPIAALAAGAYFTGGGSLAGMFGSNAAAATGAGSVGSALSSSVAPSVLSGLTAGGGAGATLGGSALGSALSSSVAPSMASALTAGSGALGSIGTALNFVKDNSYLIGQGLNLAGAGTKMMAQNQMYDELNAARRLNEQRNNDLIARSGAITDANLRTFSADNQRNLTDNAYERRMSASQGAYASPNSIYLPMAESAPKEVKDASARRIGDILDSGREQIASGVKLNSFGDTDFGNSLSLAESGRQIGTLQNFANGNNSVLSSQMNTAFAKPRIGNTVGDLFQGAGAIANAYASTRPAPPRKKTEFDKLFDDKG